MLTESEKTAAAVAFKKTVNAIVKKFGSLDQQEKNLILRLPMDENKGPDWVIIDR